MKPKKSFGQHFLNNEEVALRIVNSLSQTAAPTNVLEVGPGKGVLTEKLCETYDNFLAIEADRDMVNFLLNTELLAENQIVLKDFLKVNLADVFDQEEFSVIGNFPYNISTQIVFKMIEFRAFIPEMVGMFQKEVAQRITSDPGSKIYGVISVLTQAFYEAEYLFTVKNHNFSPPPKVQSAVIRLKRIEQAEPNYNTKLFKQIVKITFGQRRKMLRNTLKPLVKDPSILKDKYFDQRPERLTVTDFVNITKIIEREGE